MGASMTGENDERFGAGMPEVYQRCLVPVLFEPYAADLCERIAAGDPHRLLELAAGTGVLTDKLAARLPDAQITATDLAPPMVQTAAESGRHLANIDYQRMDAMDISFPDGTFDAVVCQFGVMFFPDKPAAFGEARRVLTDGGQLIFNTWDSLDANRIPQIVAAAVADYFPDDPPRFIEQVPHGYHDLDVVRADLGSVGLSVQLAQTVAINAAADSPRQLAVGFCTGTPLRNAIEARDPDAISEVVDSVERALVSEYGTGPITSEITAHVLVAQR